MHLVESCHAVHVMVRVGILSRYQRAFVIIWKDVCDLFEVLVAQILRKLGEWAGKELLRIKELEPTN